MKTIIVENQPTDTDAPQYSALSYDAEVKNEIASAMELVKNTKKTKPHIGHIVFSAEHLDLYCFENDTDDDFCLDLEHSIRDTPPVVVKEKGIQSKLAVSDECFWFEFWQPIETEGILFETTPLPLSVLEL